MTTDAGNPLSHKGMNCQEATMWETRVQALGLGARGYNTREQGRWVLSGVRGSARPCEDPSELERHCPFSPAAELKVCAPWRWGRRAGACLEGFWGDRERGGGIGGQAEQGWRGGSEL